MAEENPSTPAPLPDAAELAGQYGRRLLRAALFLCRDDAEAQDLVQETFCRAITSRQGFRGQASPYTWLYAIMRRLFLRRRRRLSRFLDSAVHREGGEDGYLPEAAFDREARQRKLEEELALLGAKHREIVLLRYVEGMKIGEMAALLGVAPGTVKSRLHHAVRRLQRSVGLAEEGEPQLQEE